MIANLKALPNLKLHMDDARSWFAATNERFDLVQMTVIDTWGGNRRRRLQPEREWALYPGGLARLSENPQQGWRLHC